MKNRTVHKNFLEKLNQVKKLVVERFPQLDMHNFPKMMRRIAHYHYNKRKSLLLGEPRELYNFLIENGYNPYTVYRWLLLDRIPEDIKFQIQQRKLSQRNAITQAVKRRHETDSSLSINIREYGMSLIRRM